MSYVNLNNSELIEKINTVPNYDTGKAIVDRLIHVFGVRNRLELGDLLGMHPGSFSTWQSRNTTPFELLVRIHLITGLSMEYLLFGITENKVEAITAERTKTLFLDGKVENVPTDYEVSFVKVFSIESGKLDPLYRMLNSKELAAAAGLGLSPDDLAISADNVLHFVNCSNTTVNSGTYLISINDVYQLSELRMLPDGKVYMFVGDERFGIDNTLTKIHGKVVSVLKRC